MLMVMSPWDLQIAFYYSIDYGPLLLRHGTFWDSGFCHFFVMKEKQRTDRPSTQEHITEHIRVAPTSWDLLSLLQREASKSI